MARVPSNMLPLGTLAPNLSLLDTISDNKKSLQELKGEKGTLVMFICNHCPFVKHVIAKLVELANLYQPKGVSFIAISSNDAEKYPEDGPDKMKELARIEKYSFSYLHDETQEVAKSYDAACTPDFYFFDKELKLVYRGQMDKSRPGNDIPVTGEDLTKAFDAILEGKIVSEDQIPSIGCNIKWKE